VPYNSLGHLLRPYFIYTSENLASQVGNEIFPDVGRYTYKLFYTVQFHKLTGGIICPLLPDAVPQPETAWTQMRFPIAKKTVVKPGYIRENSVDNIPVLL